MASGLDQMLGEVSQGVISFIEESPSFQEWPECRHSLINMLATDEPWIHALPVLTCKAVGGEQANAIPVAAAWITLVHAANLIDDIQDGNLSRLAQLESPQLAITVAIAWVFAAFRMLDDPSLYPETQNRIATIFANAGFDASMGQYQDLVSDAGKSDSDDSLQPYWSAVILKSGSICMAGAEAGAATGTGSISMIEKLGDYGTALGVIRQVIDDCQDIWIDAEIPEKRRTLPALLYSMVADQRSKRPINLRNKARLPEAKIQSQSPKMLTEAGIPEIIMDILLEWRRRALESLHFLEASEARSTLEDILEYVLTPKQQIT